MAISAKFIFGEILFFFVIDFNISSLISTLGNPICISTSNLPLLLIELSINSGFEVAPMIKTGAFNSNCFSFISSIHVIICATILLSISLFAASLRPIIVSISSMNNILGADCVTSLNKFRMICSDSPLNDDIISGPVIL